MNYRNFAGNRTLKGLGFVRAVGKAVIHFSVCTGW